MKKLLVLVSVCLCGCSSYQSYEATWQTMHAIDALQTINGIAGDECNFENNALTRDLIGKSPSKDAATKWAVWSSLLHYLLSKRINKHLDSDHFVFSFDLAYKFNTITENHRKGLRPDGNNTGASYCK